MNSSRRAPAIVCGIVCNCRICVVVHVGGAKDFAARVATACVCCGGGKERAVVVLTFVVGNLTYRMDR